MLGDVGADGFEDLGLAFRERVLERGFGHGDNIITYPDSVPWADVRLAWRVARGVELSIAGSNLLHKGHVEFDEHGFPADIPRSVYAQVRWAF